MQSVTEVASHEMFVRLLKLAVEGLFAQDCKNPIAVPVQNDTDAVLGLFYDSLLRERTPRRGARTEQ
jgi:hypothetical protein